MAVEIQTQTHLYILQQSLDETWLDLLAGNTSKSHFVVHNFEHDMVSIFWLLLWTLLVRFPCNLIPTRRGLNLQAFCPRSFRKRAYAARGANRYSVKWDLYASFWPDSSPPNLNPSRPYLMPFVARCWLAMRGEGTISTTSPHTPPYISSCG